jgi:hypothetical protein
VDGSANSAVHREREAPAFMRTYPDSPDEELLGVKVGGTMSDLHLEQRRTAAEEIATRAADRLTPR